MSNIRITLASSAYNSAIIKSALDDNESFSLKDIVGFSPILKKDDEFHYLEDFFWQHTDPNSMSIPAEECGGNTHSNPDGTYSLEDSAYSGKKVSMRVSLFPDCRMVEMKIDCGLIHSTKHKKIREKCIERFGKEQIREFFHY